MCLAIPGKVTHIDRAATPIMGKVSFGGCERRFAWNRFQRYRSASM